MKEKEIISLNPEFTEFKLLELEERLETDPIAISGLVDFTVSGYECVSCGTFNCPEVQGDCPLSCSNFTRG